MNAKGLILLQCSCGSVFNVYLQNEKSELKCRKCGRIIPFDEIRFLVAYCECGKKYKMLTNMKEECFDIDCKECGSPIAVCWNKHKHRYVNC